MLNQIIEPILVRRKRPTTLLSEADVVVGNRVYPTRFQLPREGFEPTAVRAKTMYEQRYCFAITW
jgi:hypothetical protein